MRDHYHRPVLERARGGGQARVATKVMGAI